ncbi:MAG: hypothetical protein ACYCY3_11500 [Halothiobacillus sp.]
MPKNILIAIALPQENVDKRLNRFGLPIIYTDVGKINATLQLTEALTKAAPPYSTVINLGSAESHRFAAGTIICAAHFLSVP